MPYCYICQGRVSADNAFELRNNIDDFSVDIEGQPIEDFDPNEEHYEYICKPCYDADPDCVRDTASYLKSEVIGVSDSVETFD